ncbi:MAG: SocA family protein [Elusimicrobia bacterium]|nr:SocA family protein [Elusimicrobiota bacterium]
MKSSSGLPLHFPLNEVKATQVVARLITKSGEKLNYLLLMKILYTIDRVALVNWGLPVCGGSYCSLPKGPAISEVYDLVKSSKHLNRSGYWTTHLITKNFDLSVRKPPGVGELSPAEIELVDTVHVMLAHRDKWDVVQWTHDEFKEWEDPKGSSNPIPVEKILRVLGKSESEIRLLARETSYHAQVKISLGR